MDRPTGTTQAAGAPAGTEGATTPLAEERTTLDITWHEPRGFVLLSLKNAFLFIITLGIYHFWGKTEVRRRLWHAIRVNGEPLEYTGTGKELFLGALLAMLIIVGGIFAYMAALGLLLGDMPPDYMMLPLYLVAMWLTGLAIYRARRYRLRRTRWRGIRGTMEGSPSRFATRWLFSTLLLPLTLGWSAPHRDVMLYRILTDETRIGTARLRFAPEASARALYPLFALVWFTFAMLALMMTGVVVYVASAVSNAQQLNVAAVFTYATFALGVGLIGLYLVVRYHAFRLNWQAEHTRLHDGHFRLDFQPMDIFLLVVGNALILFLTLGVLLPVVQKRMVRHFVERLGFEGTVNLAAITQATDELERTGEGFAEAFDIDAF